MHVYSGHQSKCASFPELLFLGIFNEFRNTDQKYKARIRSRFANLRDKKNPGLRQKVIAGEIEPSRVATMTAEVRN